MNYNDLHYLVFFWINDESDKNGKMVSQWLFKIKYYCVVVDLCCTIIVVLDDGRCRCDKFGC